MPEPVELSRRERRALNRILCFPLAELKRARYAAIGLSVAMWIIYYVESFAGITVLGGGGTALIVGNAFLVLFVVLAMFYSHCRLIHYQANIIRALEDELGGDEGTSPFAPRP